MNQGSSPTLTLHNQGNTSSSRVQTFINAYKRLNSDKAIFGMGVKCLVNCVEQRKRDKGAYIN